MSDQITINAPYARVIEVAENRDDGEYFSTVDGRTTYWSAITGTTFALHPAVTADGEAVTTSVTVPFSQPSYAPLEAGIVAWELAGAANVDLTWTAVTARPEPGVRSLLATDAEMRGVVDPFAAAWVQANAVTPRQQGGERRLLDDNDLDAWWVYTYRRNEVNGWLERAGAPIIAPSVFLFIDGKSTPGITRAMMWRPGVATIFPDGAIDSVVVSQADNRSVRIVSWPALSEVIGPFLQTVEAAFDDGCVGLLALTVASSPAAFAAYEDAGLAAIDPPVERAAPGAVFGRSEPHRVI